MLKTLRNRELEGHPIRVGLIGAGSMGMGIAYQLSITPGVQLSWVYDLKHDKAVEAAVFDEYTVALDCLSEVYRLYDIDVLVESSNSIQSALKYCEEAIKNRVNVVLMNAEVDLAFGPYLKCLADNNEVVVTSDAGDQHGVLAVMIEEIELWGFDIVQAGNIKGFLNRYATAESLAHEAEIRNLNPVQCCAYTDGSKLSIEMAVLANAMGYKTKRPGMSGPTVKRVEEVLSCFDFADTPAEGVVDYVLGGEPGGGVYVIGKCNVKFQNPYLKYYKLQKQQEGDFYLFYRPYHLCHLETPKAIYKAVEEGEALLEPAIRVTDVYAYAKANFPMGTEIKEAIGSDVVYGMIRNVDESEGCVPQVILECEGEKPLLKRAVAKDQLLTLDDIEWPDKTMVESYYRSENQPG